MATLPVDASKMKGRKEELPRRSRRLLQSSGLLFFLIGISRCTKIFLVPWTKSTFYNGCFSSKQSCHTYLAKTLVGVFFKTLTVIRCPFLKKMLLDFFTWPHAIKNRDAMWQPWRTLGNAPDRPMKHVKYFLLPMHARNYCSSLFQTSQKRVVFSCFKVKFLEKNPLF